MHGPALFPALLFFLARAAPELPIQGRIRECMGMFREQSVTIGRKLIVRIVRGET